MFEKMIVNLTLFGVGIHAIIDLLLKNICLNKLEE